MLAQELHQPVIKKFKKKVKARLQYLTKIIETNSVPGKIYENSGMVHFPEINRAHRSYSMLQHIGRVATTKLVAKNCLR